jgi:hypothetical protein
VKEKASKSSQFRGMTPFRVQDSFKIPLFEGKIDTYALEKWLSTLEGYYFVKKKSNSENITLSLVKSHPHVKYW